MGMNYYWREKDTTCQHCGHRGPDEKRLHIGKSSGGWCFSLRVDTKEGITSLGDWIEKFQTGLILLRHKIGRYCVGHGEGTWDLIVGEFI